VYGETGYVCGKTEGVIAQEGFFIIIIIIFPLLFSWERITTRASPNGIPRGIYSTYVQA
jgi:hypothetical protein